MPLLRSIPYASAMSSMSPYSMPLCTIFTKCPAPSVPTCVTHGPESLLAAIASNTGLIDSHDCAEPPGMSDGPCRAPSSPPDTPEPTKCSPLPSSRAVRSCVSLNQELPPSMRMSPGSSSGAILSMVMSTGLPALIIIMMRRGRSRLRTKSSNVFVPVICLPGFFATKRSTHSPSRFHTATEKPCSSTLSARFSPITPRPIIPNCAISTLRVAAAASAAGARSGRRYTFHRLRQRLQSAVGVLAEVDAEQPPVARGERLVIADGLRAAQHAEAESLAGDGHVLAAAAGELQEHAVVRAAFVQLTGGVEEARAVAGGGGDAQLARDGLADGGDGLVARRTRRDVLGERDVIARLDFRQQRGDGVGIAGVDLRAGERHRPLRLELLEQLPGVVLRLLHVRLIEGVDAQQRAGDGGGELPGEEDLAEVERIGQDLIDDGMAGVGERFQPIEIVRAAHADRDEDAIVAIIARVQRRLA